MKILACLALASLLAGCAGSSASTSVVEPAAVGLPGPVGPPPSVRPQEPCPPNVNAIDGKPCAMDGQSCGDPARDGWSLACHDGAWHSEKTVLKQ